jgi:hypothetical protein
LPASQDEQPQALPSTPAAREAEMRAMAQTLARESRKSAIVGFFGGVIVVVGLGATYYAFLQTRSSLKTEIVKTDNLTTEVKTKSVEASTAKQQAAATKAVFSATVENLQGDNATVSATTTAAIDKAFDANPSAASLLIRVYVHTSSPAQQTNAATIASVLRGAGILVPGIDVKQEKVKQTEIHYYDDDSQSLADVAAISAALAKAGIMIKPRKVPRALSDKLKPRAYGLWVGSDLSSEVAPPNPYSN